MLHLIKIWLKAPVEETDDRGRKHRSTRNRDEGRGSPQGLVPVLDLLIEHVRRDMERGLMNPATGRTGLTPDQPAATFVAVPILA
jgi:hypothetical protein